MRFTVVPGVPGMQSEFDRLERGTREQTLDADDCALARKLFKAAALLADDPFHPGLQSHEITALSRRYSTGRASTKVFQSYLENNTPAAGRLFWTYGPGRGTITLLGLEPHPNHSKKRGYAKVSLSDLPPLVMETNEPVGKRAAEGSTKRRR